MGSENAGVVGERRLNSWKEIAAFFGRDERTVKRWETNRGLPVRRMPNGPRSTVFAYERELSVWLTGSHAADAAPAAPELAITEPPISEPRQRPLRGGTAMATALAGVLVAAALALGWSVIHPPAVPAAGEHPRVAAASTKRNADAIAFYRAGLYAWQTRTPAGLTRAVDDFTQAIVRDPGYAQAYAGLANCYNLLREFSTMASEEAYPRAKAAAERAIALDPSLGDAHADLAFVDFYWLRDVGDARREFLRALALEPRSAMAHHWYATFLMTLGQSSAALREIEIAEALDSESSAIQADKGLILFHAGRKAEAATLLRRLEQLAPSFYSEHAYLAAFAFDDGDDQQFLRELAIAASLRHDDGTAAIAAVGQKGLMRGGRQGMLAAILKEQRQLYAEGRISAYALAPTCAALGNDTDSLAWLTRSVGLHEPDVVGVLMDPAFARLRKTSGFRLLLRQAGLLAAS